MEKEIELKNIKEPIISDVPDTGLEDVNALIKPRIEALDKIEAVKFLYSIKDEEEEVPEIKNYLNSKKFVKYMKRKHRKKECLKWFLYIMDTLLMCAKTMLISLFILNTIVELTYIPSGSMLPTLQLGDIEVSSKLHYLFTEPERGDIVIFYRDTDKEFEKLLTKRIIGLPGDKVEIKNKTLYINDVMYNEPYLASDAGEDIAPLIVPDNQFLLLGDNRYASLDARYWEETFVSKGNIIGKVIYIAKMPTKGAS